MTMMMCNAYAKVSKKFISS